jgi:hypothetical protein
VSRPFLCAYSVPAEKERIVTSIHKLTANLGIVISFFSLSVCAQSVGPELKHFAADGISF